MSVNKISKNLMFNYFKNFYKKNLDIIFPDEDNPYLIHLKKSNNNQVTLIPTVIKNSQKYEQIFGGNFRDYLKDPKLLWEKLNIKIKNLFFEKFIIERQLKDQIIKLDIQKNFVLLKNFLKKNSNSLFVLYLKKNTSFLHKISNNYDNFHKVKFFVDFLFNKFLEDFIAVLKTEEIINN